MDDVAQRKRPPGASRVNGYHGRFRATANISTRAKIPHPDRELTLLFLTAGMTAAGKISMSAGFQAAATNK
jgi:hypothetical protein